MGTKYVVRGIDNSPYKNWDMGVGGCFFIKGLFHKNVSNLSRKVIVCTVLPFLAFVVSEL